MKVQLFMPKSVVGQGPNNGVYWSPGLLSLASYTKKNISDIEIRIYDGELYPDNNKLKKELDNSTGVVGISSTSLNYPYVLEIAKQAKENGSQVILGGLHTTYFKELILKNRQFIDAIIYEKGEYAFFKYLTFKNKDKVPNLIWRGENNQIRKNPSGLELTLDEIELDYSLLPLIQYQENHKKVYLLMPDKSLSILTHEGCAKREIFGPCSFCSIKSKLSSRDVNLFWSEVDRAVTEYSFNLVKDWGDSLTGNKEFLKEIVEKRPKHLDDLTFEGYSNLSDMDLETIDLLKRLNVKMIFAAVESGDEGILKKMNKQSSVKEMKKAIRLIAKNNISLYSSYVLGERGETIKTLDNTLNFARWIYQTAQVEISNGSPMAILPGSPDYARLISLLPELKNKDLFDLKELKELWVKNFCPNLPNYEILEEYAEKIGRLGRLPNRYGWDPKK